jgi:hypothetical protein
VLDFESALFLWSKSGGADGVRATAGNLLRFVEANMGMVALDESGSGR